jgi:hypothetical protein
LKLVRTLWKRLGSVSDRRLESPRLTLNLDGFFCGAGTDVCVVPEESAGFSELSAAVEKTFGVDPGWYGEVMLPAFAENRRVLFEGRITAPAGAGQ